MSGGSTCIINNLNDDGHCLSAPVGVVGEQETVVMSARPTTDSSLSSRTGLNGKIRKSES